MQNLEIIEAKDEKILAGLEAGRQDIPVVETVGRVAGKVLQLLWGSTVSCERPMSLLEQGISDARYRDVFSGSDIPEEKVSDCLNDITPLYNQAIRTFKEELRQAEKDGQIKPERLSYLKKVNARLKEINTKLVELADKTKIFRQGLFNSPSRGARSAPPPLPSPAPPSIVEKPMPTVPPLAEPLSPSYLRSLSKADQGKWVDGAAEWLESYVYEDLKHAYPEGKPFKRLADALRNRFKEHPIEEYQSLMDSLEKRFQEDSEDHEEMEWDDVKKALVADPEALWSLQQMEEESYQPDVYMEDDDFYYFGSRNISHINVTYDRLGEQCSKEKEGGYTSGNAVDFATIMGVELLTEEQGKKWALAFKKYKKRNPHFLRRIFLKSENPTGWGIKVVYYDDVNGDSACNTFRHCKEGTALAFSLKVKKVKS
ncbi:MAG: DUF4256 domain-containing protein [Candidatus Gracilibacteria bacterium]